MTNLLKKKFSDLANPFALEIRTPRHGQEITRLGWFTWIVSERAGSDIELYLPLQGSTLGTYLPAVQVSAPRSALYSFNEPIMVSI